MNTAERIAATQDQLNRTLEFFPRVDGKASVILAVDTSMLAFLASKSAPFTSLRCEWVPIVLAIGLVGASLWNVYKEAFPSLDGGEESLIYFREIAKKTESKYITEWSAIGDDEYLRDLSGQIWRNSEILASKFNRVRWALTFLIGALAPWVVAIGWLSWNAANVAK